MEAASTKLRALLDACAAVRDAAGAQTDARDALLAAPAELGLSAEDRAYWGGLSEEHERQTEQRQGEPSLLEDVGVLLATAGAQDGAVLSALEVLLVHASFHCAGVVHLAHLTFRGLKVAKRWDDLAHVSAQLSDAVYAKVQTADTMERALFFWVEVVVGFQHSGELYEKNADKLAALAAFFGDEAHAGSPVDATFARCRRHFVDACAALMHYHRGYEAENESLQRAVRDAFHAAVDWPTTADAERVLRESAWVLPAGKIDRYLPSIEGKWVVDEFADDTLIPSAAGVRNAGSVLFKKLSNCYAHEVTATIESTAGASKSSTVELNGYLMQRVPDMQSLVANPQSLEQSPWTLEGHWRQMQSGQNGGAATASTPVVTVTPDWNCQACTMKNTGSATRCSTCGTVRSSSVSTTVVTSPAGSNPAPVGAVFDSTFSFLRMKWSRGEQQGVWLARREVAAQGFDLQTPLQALGDAMSDSTRMSMHAFSTQGKGSNVLVLERPVLTATSHAEYTIQVWLRPEQAAMGAEQQVILANAQEFELSMTSSGVLVWQVTGGRYTVMSGSSLEFGKLHHVTLSMGTTGMTMLVDQEVVGQVEKSPELETYGPLPPGTASLFTIGGSFETATQSTSSWSKACFYGALVDLRVWGVAVTSPIVQTQSVSYALSGREDKLLAYLPLVSKTQRLLMDLTQHENHANTMEAFQLSQDAMSVCQGDFSPTVGLQELPVKNLFSVSLGEEFIGSGAFSLDAGTGLLVESEAALWFHNSLVKAASRGFETRFSLDFDVADSAAEAVDGASPCQDTVVFALCDASFWELAPLLPEAIAMATRELEDSVSALSTGTFGRSALLVKITAELGSAVPGAVTYSLGLYVCTENQHYPLSRVHGITVSTGSKSVDAKITYSLPERVVAISLGGGNAVTFDCAVDLERALQLKSDSAIRTGLIFPIGRRHNDSAALRRLTAWSLIATDDTTAPHGDAPSASILGRVYRSMGATTADGSDGVTPVDGETATCSRVANDGSAIEQEAYGCQTCDLVHSSSICRTCAILCHEGHELVAMGAVTMACGCRSRVVGTCICETPVKKQEHPALDSPVRAAQWRCSKCTVVNGIDANQCAVCGNGAPAISTGAPASGPVLSMSRALVLAEPKPVSTPVPTIALDWACEACTMLNEPSASKCTICDTLRPSSKEPIEEAKKTTDGLVTLYSAATTSSAAESSSWTCSACTMENSATDQTCHMCSTTRAVPVVEAINEADVPLEKGTAGDPISMEVDGTSDGAAVVVPVAAAVPVAATTTPGESLSTIVGNGVYLHGYKRTVVEAMSQLLDVQTLQQSVWELPTGKMTLSISASFVGEYVQGTYLERAGNVYGLAKVTEDGSWRLAGRFKKHSQSQENACVLQWDPACSRFDGKWYRGDGAGDWKCVASPYAADFRGLATPEATQPGQARAGANSDARGSSGELQPFYLGLLNMKENLTNVCYQNSFLQALYMTRALRRLVLSTATTASHQPQQQQLVLPRIQDLFARMTSSQRPFIDTHALQRCLPPDFVSGRQQDTSDFAHYLIDAMTQEMEAIEHENERARSAADNLGEANALAAHDPAHRIAEIFGGHQATILSCKSCGKTSVNREYFWELLLNMIDLRYTPITDIRAVTGSSSMDIQTPQGFERLNADLNKDRAGAPYVYLCLKRRPERADEDGIDENDSRLMPITDLLVKVAPISEPKPIVPGYNRVELDLNVGGSAAPASVASSTAASAVVATSGGKKQVYLFYRRERDGVPITDLQVVYGNDTIPDGFKQIPIDLNQGAGSRVLLCYRCDMPITDIQIVNGGIPGYRMVDHLLNRNHDDVVKQYLALKVGGNEPCLTDLKLVDGKDIPEFQSLGWQAIGSPVSFHPDTSPTPIEVDEEENETSTFSPPQLMVRRGHGNPIFAIDVFRAPRQVPKYNDYEVIDLYPLPTPAESLPRSDDSPSDADADPASAVAALPSLIGDWMGTESTERVRRAVRIRTETAPTTNALLIKGELDDKGELVAVATVRTAWAPTATVPSVDGSDAAPTSVSVVYNVTGYWTNSKTKRAQLFDVELRPTSTALMDDQGANAYSMEGKMSDTVRSVSPVAIRGVQTSRQVKVKWPITELMVLRGDERVPEGAQVLRETCSGRSGNLLAQTASPHTLYLAVKRSAQPAEGFVADVCVIYGEIDTVPEGYVCVQLTPAGHSANLNDGTAGVPVFICYRRHPLNNDVDAAKGDKCVMDLALMWTSGTQADTVPAGFTKIQHTPLGMEANLNQGTTGVAIHLCVSKCALGDVVQPIDHALNGEYELSSLTNSPLVFGRFVRLSVVEELAEARTVEGSFGAVLHGYLHGALRGVLFSTTSRLMPQRRMLLGVWTSDGGNGAAAMTDVVPPNHPFQLALDDTSGELDGWWSGPEPTGPTAVGSTATKTSSSPTHSASATSASSSGGGNKKASALGEPWCILRDSYVRIAFKKDYGTEWQDGKLVFSERVWQHDLASMLSRFVATRTMGGDNALRCSACGDGRSKTESRAHTVIASPPEHLIITLKRMYYDWTHQKTRKCLHDVTFSAHLTLPALNEEEARQVGVVVQDDADAEMASASDASAVARRRHDVDQRQYGLYGVLVHSGLTANSGHYYSFCRESDERTRQLHLEDAPRAPWIKFNDTKVERSSWRELRRHVSNTVADTVYLLLYKRLHYEVPVDAAADDAESGETMSVSGSGDEEAMLLAKAMALSMAAATKPSGEEEEVEEESKQEDAGDEASAEDEDDLDATHGLVVNKQLLKTVRPACGGGASRRCKCADVSDDCGGCRSSRRTPRSCGTRWWPRRAACTATTCTRWCCCVGRCSRCRWPACSLARRRVRGGRSSIALDR